jgi:hypothetical protein
MGRTLQVSTSLLQGQQPLSQTPRHRLGPRVHVELREDRCHV